MKCLFPFLFFLIVTVTYANEMYDDNYRNLTIIDNNVSLNSRDVIKKGFLITKSNITFDCNGATLDGGNKLPYGILIDSKGKNINNIVVKNCNLKGFTKNAIYVGWLIGDNLKSNISKTVIYSNHPNNISLINNNIFNNSANGIYVDDYVSIVKILNSKIYKNGGVGIYLEFSSKENTIINNMIYGNGYGKYGRREGLAIDGSFNNLVKSNNFFNNTAGGVFLYKNCQENSKFKYSAVRKDGASFNTIKNNNFYNEKVGVWIASRQSKNLQAQQCGDKPMYKNIYYEDFANNNILTENNFCKVERGIIVEGDFNKIYNNSFGEDVKSNIFLPVTARQKYLKRPQIGNLIKENIQNNSNCVNKVPILESNN